MYNVLWNSLLENLMYPAQLKNIILSLEGISNRAHTVFIKKQIRDIDYWCYNL